MAADNDFIDPYSPFIAELKLTNNPDSATRQFYINLNDNDFLNASQRPPGYAVFGKVTQGFDVIQKMATKKTKSLPNGMRDIPVEPIIITKATLIK